MALPLEKLGSTHPPRTALIDPERAKQYATATNGVVLVRNGLAEVL
jgi:hypothetical protein